MEFTFNFSFDRIENPPPSWNPVTRKWVMPTTPAYTSEQYAILGGQIEEILSVDFVSIGVIERPADQLVRITYVGHMDGDVEVRREADMDPVINAWIAAQAGGEG